MEGIGPGLRRSFVRDKSTGNKLVHGLPIYLDLWVDPRLDLKREWRCGVGPGKLSSLLDRPLTTRQVMRRGR